MTKLDYSLKTIEERQNLVNQILREDPNPSEKFLELIADYLVLCVDKKEKQQKNILTPNRLATINKREVSLEGLASQFENGEDGIYDLIIEEDKNILFKPKIGITEEDIIEIPELQQARGAIDYWENRLKTASGKEAFIIKQAIIEFRRDQYLIKNAKKTPIQTRITPAGRFIQKMDGNVIFNAAGECATTGITLVDPEVCGAILREYNALKLQCIDNTHSDLWALMLDFDALMERALVKLPGYKKIIECKINGLSNTDTQIRLKEDLNISYTPEYISNLWRNKIPKVIANKAEDEYLNWYYLEVEKGQYKKCGRCGQVKLAHTKYYCKNKNSKDGWYSICKECRSTKKQDGDDIND